jgi:hypothetical protein
MIARSHRAPQFASGQGEEFSAEVQALGGETGFRTALVPPSICRLEAEAKETKAFRAFIKTLSGSLDLVLLDEKRMKAQGTRTLFFSCSVPLGVWC